MSNNPTTKDIIKAILTNNNLNEEEKASLVEELMNEIKKEYPDLKYHATKSDVKELELKLTKEIEEVRKEIKEVELRLGKEIEETRKEIKEIELGLKSEIKEVELKLTKEIENIRKEIKELDLKLNKEIKETKVSMIKWSFLFWITQLIAIISILFKLKG